MGTSDISPEAAKALAELIDWERKNCVPDDLKAKGWEYRDLPGKFSPEMWDLLLSAIGEGEYVVLVQSQGDGPNGPWKRGQLCISPQGFKNMEAYSAARKSQSEAIMAEQSCTS